MADKIEVGGLYRFHAPKVPGAYAGPWRDMTWTVWDELQTAYDQNIKANKVKFEDGTVFLIVDHQPLHHMFNLDATDENNNIWLHKIIIGDVCGWTLIDKGDPELWDDYMTTFDDCLERL